MENEKTKAYIIGNVYCPNCKHVMLNDIIENTTTCLNGNCGYFQVKYKLPEIEVELEPV